MEGAARRWKGALDRDAPPSLTRGAGAAVLAPAKVVRKDGSGGRDRARQRQDPLASGTAENAVPGGAPLEAPLAEHGTERRATLASAGAASPAGQSGRSAVKRLFHSSYSRDPCMRLRPRAGLSREKCSGASRGARGGSRTKSTSARGAGWFAEVDETHLSRERGGQPQGFPRRRGVARWLGPRRIDDGAGRTHRVNGCEGSVCDRQANARYPPVSWSDGRQTPSTERPRSSRLNVSWA